MTFDTIVILSRGSYLVSQYGASWATRKLPRSNQTTFQNTVKHLEKHQKHYSCCLAGVGVSMQAVPTHFSFTFQKKDFLGDLVSVMRAHCFFQREQSQSQEHVEKATWSSKECGHQLCGYILSTANQDGRRTGVSDIGTSILRTQAIHVRTSFDRRCSTWRITWSTRLRKALTRRKKMTFASSRTTHSSGE